MFIESKKIIIGSDHGGFELKSALIEHLSKRGLTVEDAGTYNTDSVDYPSFGAKVGKAVSEGSHEAGIVICGTGIGISIAANRFKGVRASLCHSTEYAELTRLHNNSNILALGGRFLTLEEAVEITNTWLDTEYEGGRHEKRVQQLDSVC